MIARTLRPTFTVAQVIASWPATATAFSRYGMACVGCTMASFDTLAEVAATYRQDLEAWLEELSFLAGVPFRIDREATRRDASKLERPHRSKGGR